MQNMHPLYKKLHDLAWAATQEYGESDELAGMLHETLGRMSAHLRKPKPAGAQGQPPAGVESVAPDETPEELTNRALNSGGGFRASPTQIPTANAGGGIPMSRLTRQPPRQFSREHDETGPEFWGAQN